MSRFTRCALVVLTTLAMATALTGVAQAATPDHDTLSPDSGGKGSKTWTGQVTLGGDAAGDSDGCFGNDKKPDPTSGCDFYKLTVNVPNGFYNGFLGGVQVTIDGFGQADLDLGIYRLNADGTRGDLVTGSGNAPGMAETTTIGQASGDYIVAVRPLPVPGIQSYNGKAEFTTKAANPTLDALNRQLGNGRANFRASHDKYLSRSDTSIPLDPL